MQGERPASGIARSQSSARAGVSKARGPLTRSPPETGLGYSGCPLLPPVRSPLPTEVVTAVFPFGDEEIRDPLPHGRKLGTAELGFAF